MGDVAPRRGRSKVGRMVAAERSRRAGLAGKNALAAAAAMASIAFAGSTLVTPLYVLYRHRFGFSELILTLIYAAYAIGNLLALLVFGRLSDEIGRRPVALVAMTLAAIAAAAFLFAESTGWLFAGRIVSGLAVGLASGTAAAWLAELVARDDMFLATLLASCANFVGLAVGPLTAGLLGQYAPQPATVPYLVYLAALAAVGVAVAATPETVREPARHLAALSLKPRIGVPARLRAAFISPAVTAFSTFSLVGFYSALCPTVLTRVLHLTSKALGGGVLFEIFLIATLAMIASRRLASRKAMLTGLVLLLPSLGLLVLAQLIGSLAILLVGAAVTGVAAALGYRGSLLVVNRIAPDDRRAEVVSSYYVACFCGNALPVIGVGALSALSGIVTAGIVFAATIAAFAIAAMITGLRYTPA